MNRLWAPLFIRKPLNKCTRPNTGVSHDEMKVFDLLAQCRRWRERCPSFEEGQCWHCCCWCHFGCQGRCRHHSHRGGLFLGLPSDNFCNCQMQNEQRSAHKYHSCQGRPQAHECLSQFHVASAAFLSDDIGRAPPHFVPGASGVTNTFKSKPLKVCGRRRVSAPSSQPSSAAI